MFFGCKFTGCRVFLIGVKYSLGLGIARLTGIAAESSSMVASARHPESIRSKWLVCDTRFLARSGLISTDEEGESSSIVRFTGLQGRSWLGVSGLPFSKGVLNKDLSESCFLALRFFEGLDGFFVGDPVRNSCFGAVAFGGVLTAAFAGLGFMEIIIFKGLVDRIFVGVVTSFAFSAVLSLAPVASFFGEILLDEQFIGGRKVFFPTSKSAGNGLFRTLTPILYPPVGVRGCGVTDIVVSHRNRSQTRGDLRLDAAGQTRF